MVNTVCTNCGHRKMDADTGPKVTLTTDKQIYMVTLTMVSAWARMNELKVLVESGRNGILVPLSIEDRADYDRLCKWWQNIGASSRNAIKSAAFKFSKNIDVMTKMLPTQGIITDG